MPSSPSSSASNESCLHCVAIAGLANSPKNIRIHLAVSRVRFCLIRFNASGKFLRRSCDLLQRNSLSTVARPQSPTRLVSVLSPQSLPLFRCGEEPSIFRNNSARRVCLAARSRNSWLPAIHTAPACLWQKERMAEASSTGFSRKIKWPELSSRVFASGTRFSE